MPVAGPPGATARHRAHSSLKAGRALAGPVPAALVTGAGRGIGAAIARRLARDGHDVAIHFHTAAEGARRTAEKVVAEGRHAQVMQADLGDPEAAWGLAEATVARFDDLSVLVNNAGLYDRRHLADMTGEAWRRTMAVDLDAPALLTQALRVALAQNGGSVVHVSSVAAVRGSSHGAHYAAAKAGLLGLARAQAKELAPEVRVNAVCPGYIGTDMLADDSDRKRRQREQEVPLQRIGSADDVAGAVSFLAAPDSAYMTGQVLHVNGGLWMG